MAEDKLTKEKIEKYLNLTEKALKIAEKNIAEGREKEGEEILKMTKCYLADSKHFFGQGDYVDSFACVNYAHGWLDCGARLKIFKVKDNKLFAIG